MVRSYGVMAGRSGLGYSSLRPDNCKPTSAFHTQYQQDHGNPGYMRRAHMHMGAADVHGHSRMGTDMHDHDQGHMYVEDEDGFVMEDDGRHMEADGMQEESMEHMGNGHDDMEHDASGRSAKVSWHSTAWHSWLVWHGMRR